VCETFFIKLLVN